MNKGTENRPHIVYILQSQASPRQYYAGLTRDIKARLAAHNAGNSKHTSKYLPWTLVYCAWFANATKAFNYEKYLKSGSGRAFASKHLR